MAKTESTVRRTQGILGGRSAEVVDRVLKAALAELARSGYAGFRMDAVVAAAEVNKTTIYRRWPNRMALATSVVQRLRMPLAEAPLPDTGEVERDLILAFQRRAKFTRSLEGKAWARLLDERANPEVRRLIRAAVDERAAEWQLMICRAISRGELPRKTDPTLVLHVIRAIVAEAPKNTAWVILAVRTALAGARAGTLELSRRPKHRTLT